MAKHKSQRALFELLSSQRGREKGGPDVGAPPRPAIQNEPPAPVRPVQMPRTEEPAPIIRRPVLAAMPTMGGVSIGGVQLTAYHLIIAGVVLVCLCVLFYLLGARFGGTESLPVTEKHPTMDEIRATGVTPGLVKPPPAPVAKAKGPTKGPDLPAPAIGDVLPPTDMGLGGEIETEPPVGDVPPGPAPGAGKAAKAAISAKTPAAPAGPQFRVRIARVDVSKTSVIDELRAYLSTCGVETELVTRAGVHVLYSAAQFGDKAKSDELAAQINKHLGAYEKQTKRPTSKDAYTVQTKEKKE